MEDCIDLIGSWLTDGSCHSADMLTIVGMVGLGRRLWQGMCLVCTIVVLQKEALLKISMQDVKKTNGMDCLLDLQKKLHRDIAVKADQRCESVNKYIPKIEIELAHKRVFIVLDNIGSHDQLDALLGKKGFCKGSKIIITTKDSSLAETWKLFNPQVQPKHKKVSLKGLNDDESLGLLRIHAFKGKKPEDGYEEVLEKLVEYCEGNPLALKVLGCSLQQHDVAHWNDCIT
ncbi:disease resistance protein Roq1-like [Bidens hawaiensis]|uniref:disease resistance protein Roq1-like n=1 Tax=Bidens hawaiensis TaxID=980011 RepID=UPI00404B3D76